MGMYDSLSNPGQIGQNALLAFQQARELRKRDDQQKALTAYATDPNDNNLNALAHYAPEFVIQQRQATAKQQQEQAKGQQEQMKIVSNLLRNVTDEASFQRARAIAQQNGIPLDRVPQHYDPQWVGNQVAFLDAFEKDGGQHISGLARELQDAGYQPGSPEFQKAMMTALQGKYAPQYTDAQGNLRQARLPDLPPPGQPAQQVQQQPTKETSFEAASDIARQMGPEFPDFVRNNGFRVRVASPEQAMQLPRGTPLILPDGSEGVVP